MMCFKCWRKGYRSCVCKKNRRLWFGLFAQPAAGEREGKDND
jgi:hypothetical protein